MANPLSAPPILPPPRPSGGGKGVKGGVVAFKPAPAPRPAPVARPTGPGYGVLRPGVRSAPAPRPTFRAPPRVFAQPLPQATRQNIKAGAALREYAAQNPKAAAYQRQFEANRRSTGGLASILTGSKLTGTLLGAINPELGRRVERLGPELLNIPIQTLPSTWMGVQHLLENNQGAEQKEANEYMHGSALGRLIKGDFHGALKIAGERPIATGLETAGALSAFDRAAGFVHDVGKAPRELLKGPVTRGPRAMPEGVAPEGGAMKPQRPFSKGYVRPKFEKAMEKPLSPTGAGKFLKQHHSHFEGEMLRVTRQTRTNIMHEDSQALKTHPHIPNSHAIPGKEALSGFATFMADPKVINPETGQPFWKEHLAQYIQDLRKVPENETPYGESIRNRTREHFEGLLNDQALHDNPGPVFDAATQLAKNKAALEPDFKTHNILVHDQIRAAKLTPSFRFHFKDQNPRVEPVAEIGESPFSLNGRSVSMNEVAKKLEEKGVHESQLSFISTRPFQSETAPLTSGYRPGGKRVSTGHLSGTNFMRGHWDPTPEAAMRQHLADAQLINHARGDLQFANNYAFKREELAKLIEKKLGGLTPAHRAALEDMIQKELRSKPGDHYFSDTTESAYRRAEQIANEIKAVDPKIDLTPVRIAHPYATTAYRAGMGRHLDVGAAEDKLDPNNTLEEGWGSRIPSDEASKDAMRAGPVALVHRSIADSVNRFQRELGSEHRWRMPSSWWRQAAVAYSPRHIPGVLQEQAIRAIPNGIGGLSMIRGSRALHEVLNQARDHPDPLVKLGAQRLEANLKGMKIAQTEDLMRKRPQYSKWWEQGESRKVIGAPAKAVIGAVRAFGAVTHTILSVQRRILEQPPQVAGFGKHLNNEFKLQTGKSLNVLKAFDPVEKAWLKGTLDPRAIDHFTNVSHEYWGDWTKSSPGFKNAQAFIPFLQWYVNALRFVYYTMPVHHPIATGVLVSLENANREVRRLEGQEYKGGLAFHLNASDLEASQQGSVPNPFGAGRLGSEYYMPIGAISQGPLNSSLGALTPWAVDSIKIMEGINPITNQPLTETVAGKKIPIKDQGKLAWLGALALAENAVPPIRTGKTIASKGAGYAFRPLRTEKTYRQGSKKEIAKEAKETGQELEPGSVGSGPYGKALGEGSSSTSTGGPYEQALK